MDVKYLLCVLGLVFVIEGLPYFAFPHRIKTWFRQIIQVPEANLRVLGFGAMAFGLILVYLVSVQKWGTSARYQHKKLLDIVSFGMIETILT